MTTPASTISREIHVPASAGENSSDDDDDDEDDEDENTVDTVFS